MSQFLTQTFCISSHPVKKLDLKFRLQYVMGLCEFVHRIIGASDKGKFVCFAWGKSILSEDVPESFWSETDKLIFTKKAIKIRRLGFKFFTMRQFFFFDCFYLLEKSGFDHLDGAHELLDKRICGFFSRRKLSQIWKIFAQNAINLVDTFCESFMRTPIAPLYEHRNTNQEFHKKKLKKVLVVATMSSGKSTLINALTGYKLNKVKATACTHRLTYLYNKPQADGITFVDEKQRYNYSYDIMSVSSNNFVEAAFHFNSELADERICIIDTPGVNYAINNKHGELTRNAIKDNDYDIILFVFNATQFAINDEDEFLEYVIKNTKKKMIFAINQLDRFKESEDSVEDIMAQLQRRLKEKGLKKPDIVAVSALAGLLFKMKSNGLELDEEEELVFSQFNRKFRKPFYNFSRYNNKTTEGTSDATGVKCLEKTIANI